MSFVVRYSALARDDLKRLYEYLLDRAINSDDLEHEEAVMVPLTLKTAPMPEGRARVVHHRLLTPSAALADFDWFVSWRRGAS